MYVQAMFHCGNPVAVDQHVNNNIYVFLSFNYTFEIIMTVRKSALLKKAGVILLLN